MQIWWYLAACVISLVPLAEHGGSVDVVYRFTKADTKDQTIHHSKPMTPKQRKNDGYSIVNRYTRTEPSTAFALHLFSWWNNFERVNALFSVCVSCPTAHWAEVIMHRTKAKQGTKESFASWTKGKNNRMLLFVLHPTLLILTLLFVLHRTWALFFPREALFYSC